MGPKKNQIYAVIMAGGVGSRFWPRSRRRLPKQFLPILHRRTMLEETCRRLRPLVPWENVVVVARAGACVSCAPSSSDFATAEPSA
jgi:mannose-1-phosphate guanylyltransferase